ncbi:MAG: hypothetical protein K2I60_04300, partial [Oscillospiraceae bacterium]|nr:hypothetical protein [Oscillospiraceae bacterium]
MKGTKQLAFCGIISAISVALMFISGIFSFLSYAIPGICGALLIMVMIDISKSKSFLIYIVVGVLSLLIVANKTSVLAYILLLGYYPILKFFIENIKNTFFECTLKLLVFLLSLALFLVISSFFVGLDMIFSLGPI